MNLFDYLKDRFITLVLGLICIASVAIVLSALDVGRDAVSLVCFIIAAGVVAEFTYEYLRRRRFYRELEALTKQMPQAYYVTELMEPPLFLEGRITYDALRIINKSMADEVGIPKTQLREYRDYIELWIHEIKTPIAAANLMCTQLHGGVADRVKGELDRIEAAVEQALYYARSTSLESDFAIREVVLADVVREAVRRHARFLIACATTPTFDIPQDATVFADKKWLAFIVGQIVVNAAKYGATTAAFSVRVEREGSSDARTVLMLADDGCGIAAADVPRVFDKGFTGENGHCAQASTGMGLYLCAIMCEKMGLRVSLTSQVDHGTCVSIALPHDRRRLDMMAPNLTKG
ncbi:MAG: sensor histidine kinase [Raoultibacter sp.]